MEGEIIFALNLELIGAGAKEKEVKRKKRKRKEVKRWRPWPKHNTGKTHLT